MTASKSNLWVGAAVIAALGVGAWTWFASTSDDGAKPAASAPAKPLGTPVAASAAPAVPASSALETATSRFKVVGLMIQGNDRRVLISVDGQPARIYRVGETVDGNLVVKSVSDRGAVLGPRDGNDNLALDVTQDQAAAAAPLPPVPAPPRSNLPKAPLSDGSAQAQETLRRLGARHAPIVPPPQAAAPKPAPAPSVPVDDGRWRPAGQQ